MTVDFGLAVRREARRRAVADMIATGQIKAEDADDYVEILATCACLAPMCNW